jgi:hypothetical protein
MPQLTIGDKSVTVKGLHRWFPVALILQGPRATSDGPPREYDTFRFRCVDFVNADGTLRHPPDVGWLPMASGLNPCV